LSATANSLCGLSGLNHLILELLNRAGAEADHPTYLADADAGRQELPSFLDLVHNPNYDFNDAALPIGASLFARLVEKKLLRLSGT